MAATITDVTNWSPVIPLLPSTATTASPNPVQLQGLQRHSGIVVVVDVSAVTSTAGVTVSVVGVDRVSGNTWPILTSAAITTVSTTALRIHPGIAVVANQSTSDVLPPLVQINFTNTNSASITYSATAYLTY